MKFLPQYAFKSWVKRLAVFFFDAAGAVIFFPLRCRKKIRREQVKKILAIRLDHLGDVVMTRPALGALREMFPEAQIDLLVGKEWAPLFEDAREVRETIGMTHHWFRKSRLSDIFTEARALAARLRSQNYDLAIDFRGDLRSILLVFFAGIPRTLGYGITGGKFLLSAAPPYPSLKHQVEVNLALLETLGIPHPDTSLQPFSYSGSRKWRFWHSIGTSLSLETQKRIIVHAGAGYPSKRWPAAHFLELVQKLSAIPKVEIVLVGTEKEKLEIPFPEIPHVVDLRGKTEVADLPILMDASHLYVGNDSGPAHMAAAQGIPLVVLFSGTNIAKLWHPWSRRLNLCIHPVDCSPCQAQTCPLKHHDCMVKITPDQVFSKITALLKAA